MIPEKIRGKRRLRSGGFLQEGQMPLSEITEVILRFLLIFESGKLFSILLRYLYIIFRHYSIPRNMLMIPVNPLDMPLIKHYSIDTPLSVFPIA
jgi:hypothetical protein